MRGSLVKLVTLIGNAAVWVTAAVGCFVTAMAIAQIYMLMTGSRPGTPISPDDLAPTPRAALLDLGYGICFVLAPFLPALRHPALVAVALRREQAVNRTPLEPLRYTQLRRRLSNNRWRGP